jgi:ABC-type nickel/cobalt efflux system permease component RcnA
MRRRELHRFIADVQRFRPLAAVVLAVALMLPSFGELATGNLSAVTFLARLALALAVGAVLVWAVTGVVLRYARMQARIPAEGEPFGAARGDLDG